MSKALGLCTIGVPVGNAPTLLTWVDDLRGISDTLVAAYRATGASLTYPSCIIINNIYPKHLGKDFVDALKMLTAERLAAKKTNKVKADALKITINGLYGKLNSDTFWLEDAFAMLRVTIAGQLYILMLIESLELNGIHCISANTDGIECLVKAEDIENYYAICKEWERGTPRKGFPQKHDDILIYSKGEDFYWDGDSVQIKKKTAGTKLDKKGTGLKTPCSVFDDLGNFSTIDKERVKDPESGKNIRWQKPMKLMDRLLLPFTKKGDLIIDPFCGSGTTPAWAHINGRDCYAIEKDKSVYEIALSRLKNND